MLLLLKGLTLSLLHTSQEPCLKKCSCPRKSWQLQANEWSSVIMFYVSATLSVRHGLNHFTNADRKGTIWKMRRQEGPFELTWNETVPKWSSSWKLHRRIVTGKGHSLMGKAYSLAQRKSQVPFPASLSEGSWLEGDVIECSLRELRWDLRELLPVWVDKNDLKSKTSGSTPK